MAMGKWRGCEFKRTHGGEWERWPNTSTPSPPPRDRLPLKPCYWDHEGCADWRGVHFVAIRYDGVEVPVLDPLSA